ncbi:uncharacterized protein [Diabrotica undecimpunctata]|uniref:uncharacterized protein n=1 Tax=Diabrotica undecimpunctata TaxID=50387 RepID=UPI003B63D76C
MESGIDTPTVRTVERCCCRKFSTSLQQDENDEGARASCTSSHDTQHIQSGIQAHSHSHSFDSQDVTQLFSALSLTNKVVLATALVTLVDKDKNLVHARALLDNGSQTSFITQELVNRLGLPSYNRLLKISTLSQSCSTSNKMIDLIIYPFKTTHNGFNVSCTVLPTITCKLPQIKISRSHLSIPHDINLADHSFSVPGKIDMLLGNDIYCDLLTDGIIKLGNGPILQNTHLGYIFQGRLPSQSIPNYPSHFSDNNKNSCFSTQVSLCINSLNNTEPLDALIQRFWEVEELPESPMLSQDDELAEHIFKTTTKLLPEGRFQVDLPLRSSAEPTRLGNSFYSTRQRFYNLERKLVKDNTVYTQYKDFIQEYLSLGHAKVVPLTLTNPLSDNKYFIPHHCIIREEKLTNKLRVVFDCSMKTSSSVSLNDIMLKGFAHNTRKPPEKFSNNLSVNELKSAELKIVKLIQDDSFSQEISLLKTKRPITNKSLLSMDPFLDEHEMLRIGGRLKYASVPFDQKYPLLLPSKNQLVKLMLRREHIRLCHAGPQCTLSNFRLKYWPLDALREIKRIINSCKICFRFKAQTASQLMADLPRERLVCSQAFTTVGTDLGGPYNLKTSKLRKAPITKCYIVVFFICMVTRAYHLELVSNLTTKSFLLTIKRFISRRGNPSAIFSNNATNFLGSKNQLREFAQFLRNQDTQNSIEFSHLDYMEIYTFSLSTSWWDMGKCNKKCKVPSPQAYWQPNTHF